MATSFDDTYSRGYRDAQHRDIQIIQQFFSTQIANSCRDDITSLDVDAANHYIQLSSKLCKLIQDTKC